MTFIVTVAHFCEVHGPSMVMCTQTSYDPSKLESFYSLPIPESQLCQSCMLIISNKDDSKDAADVVKPVAKQKSDLLEADSSLENSITNLLRTSKDDATPQKPSTIQTKSKSNSDITYITTQFPTYRHRYSSLRQIIMRVFTVETTFDLTKPLTFGDSKQGYSIALCFKLTDKTARGAERKYSIIVTSDKESELLKNYTFILINLVKIVEFITTKSKKVLEKGSEGASLKNNNDVYLRRSSAMPKHKSLVDILDDDDLFLRLHLWAAFLLEKIESCK